MDIKTHFKPTETFQYTHFSGCQKKGGQKGLHQGRSTPLKMNSKQKSRTLEHVLLNEDT